MSAGIRVWAAKFAQHHRAVRGDFFHGAGAAPWNDPVSIDYFVWLIRTPDGDLVFDVGFVPEVARERNRPDYFRRPSEAIELLGVDPSTVGHVVISHLHYDHAGDHAAFTNAKFVLQEAELRFWTGPYAHRRELARHIETRDVASFAQYSLDGRVQFVDGDRELLPGVSVHRVGGHTPGMQVLRVQTSDGPLVLASDAAHMAENLEMDAPTSVFTDLPGVYAGFDRMLELAEGRLDRIYAGHDATLLDRLESAPGLEGIAGIVV